MARKPNPSHTDAIAAAHAAAIEGDFATALVRLLDAWRATPAPALADAIDAIGERAAKDLMPPSGRTPKERAAAWNVAATGGDPVIRQLLVASIAETKGNADTLARLRLLEDCRDPRFASAIVAMLEVPPYNVTVHRTQPFWKYVLARLPELGDARILARARACPPRWTANTSLNPPEREMLEKKLAKLLPALEAAYGDPPALAVADADRVRAIVETTRATGGERAEADQAAALLAAIYANPADDAARLVYADWLGERGDPRGELITLQLTADPTPAMRRRAAALVDGHATRWLGPLAPQVRKTGLRFERGFLAACHIIPPVRDVPPPDPAWSTLVEVAGRIPDAGPGGLPALRVATGIANEALEKLVAMPLRLEALGWVPEFDERDFGVAISLFKKLKMPTLRRLEFRNFVPREGTRAPAFVAPAWRHLPITELAVTGEPEDLREWIVAVRETPLTHFTLIATAWAEIDWRFAVTRSARDAAFDQLVITGPSTAKPPRMEAFALEVGRVLEGFAEDALATIQITLPKLAAWKKVDAGLRARITTALARQPRATPVIEHA